MQEIPEKLKWYQPLGHVDSYVPRFHGSQAWQIVVGKWTDCVEIKRAPLLRISATMKGLIFAAILCGALLAIPHAVPFLELDIPVDEEMLFIFMVILSPLLIIGVPAFDALTTIIDSKRWKVPLRFRYDSRDSVLFFPRENVTYRLKDCQKTVLGCVRGYDKRGWSKSKTFNVYYKIGTTGRPGRDKSHRPVTQIFMLVLDEHNEWHRHNLADDWAFWRTHESGSKQFVKFVKKLQPLLECEVFIKDYSVDECFEQQNSKTFAGK